MINHRELVRHLDRVRQFPRLIALCAHAKDAHVCPIYSGAHMGIVPHNYLKVSNLLIMQISSV